MAQTDYGYDDIGQLTDLNHTHDTTTIADYDWTFDAFSRITSLSFTSSVGDSGDSDYTYDDTGQFTDVDHDYQTDESYSYDENGNRTISGYTTDDNNLTTSDGTYDYEYDDEGNRVLKTNSSTGDYTEYDEQRGHSSQLGARGRPTGRTRHWGEYLRKSPKSYLTNVHMEVNSAADGRQLGCRNGEGWQWRVRGEAMC